jgi:hypothetical protein
MESGSLTSWNPLGHTGPVTGLLYLLLGQKGSGPSLFPLNTCLLLLPTIIVPSGYLSLPSCPGSLRLPLSYHQKLGKYFSFHSNYADASTRCMFIYDAVFWPAYYFKNLLYKFHFLVFEKINLHSGWLYLYTENFGREI